jgi:hypothetical protein
MAGLIWLASYPKSGSTWVRAFLHNLLRPRKTAYDINHLDDLVLSESSRGWYDQAHGKPTGDLSDLAVLRLTPHAHARIARRSSDDVFVKTHTRMGLQNGVDLTSGSLTAGAIYIIRNPFSVVVSAADHFGVSIDEMIDHMGDPAFRTAADGQHVSQYIGDWSSHVEGWAGTPHRRLLVLRYEDLLLAPGREFARLCTFLGMRPSSERLEHAVQSSSFENLQTQEMRAGFKERAPHARAFFREGSATTWRGALSQDQVDRISAKAGRTMQRFGYLAARQPMTYEKEWSDHV